MDDKFRLFDSMRVDNDNINSDVAEKDSLIRQLDLTMSKIYLKNDIDKRKFALFHPNLDHYPKKAPHKKAFQVKTLKSLKKIDAIYENQETQLKNKPPVEYNVINIYSADLKNTAIVKPKNPTSKTEKKNPTSKTGKKIDNKKVHFAPNSSVLHLGGPNLVPQKEKETLREKKILKGNKILSGRHFRGLKHISGYVKDIIIVNKSTTYPRCAEMISSMFAAELKIRQKTTESSKLLEIIEKEKINVMRSVYQTQNILISAKIFQEVDKTVTLDENAFRIDVSRYRWFAFNTQQKLIEYKRAQLCGMIKKYAILKNIIARNKITPKKSHISMPFLVVHRTDHHNSKMSLEKSEDDKTAKIFCTGDIIMHGHMKAQLSSKIVKTLPDHGFAIYIKEAIAKISEKQGSIPSFLEEGGPLLADLMSMDGLYQTE